MDSLLPPARVSQLFERFEHAAAGQFDGIAAATPFIAARFLPLNPRTYAICNYPMLSEFDSSQEGAAPIRKERAVCYAGSIAKVRGIREMVEALRFTDVKLLAGTFAVAEEREYVTARAGWKSVEELGHLDRDGVRRLSYDRQDILEESVRLRREIRPEMVFLPASQDVHQDHQVLHTEGLRAFKDLSVLGYELPWNHLTLTVQAFVELEGRHLERKWEALQAYRSQIELKRSYFTKEFISGLAAVRGTQIRRPMRKHSKCCGCGYDRHDPSTEPVSVAGLLRQNDAADRFILLDHVPFTKGGFQNRVKLKGSGGGQWLTVPDATGGKSGRRTDEVRLSGSIPWRKDHLRTFEALYRETPRFGEIFPALEFLYGGEQSTLTDFTVPGIELIRECLGIATPLYKSSELAAEGSASELLANLTAQLGGTIYLSGPSGRNYLDERPFAAKGIRVAYHRFDAFVYPQRFGDFAGGLSALDLLFNGAEEIEWKRGAIA